MRYDRNITVQWVWQERCVYDPYRQRSGKTASWGSAFADGIYCFRYGHQGGRHDPSSGLTLFRNRSYSPTLGRWVQQDPFGYVDGASLYQYELSAPISSLDSSGLQVGGGPNYGPPKHSDEVTPGKGYKIDPLTLQDGTGMSMTPQQAFPGAQQHDDGWYVPPPPPPDDPTYNPKTDTNYTPPAWEEPVRVGFFVLGCVCFIVAGRIPPADPPLPSPEPLPPPPPGTYPRLVPELPPVDDG